MYKNIKPIIIVAYTNNYVIGMKNTIPWKLPGDMKNFKKVTTGNIVIMGRKTWESLKAPLYDRINIVISRRSNYQANGAYVFENIDTALKSLKNSEKQVFIIGGEQIYLQSISLVEKILATEIFITIKGDAFFPKLKNNEWIETSRNPQQENKIYYDFVTYQRIR